MKNLYDYVKANPTEVRQYSCKDLLFLKMDCPPALKFDDWNEHNCFIHVLNGTKCLYSRERSWLLQKGATLFVKKGAITVEKLEDEPLCALMFFVPDEYVRCFMKENAALIPAQDFSLNTRDQVLPVQTTPVMHAFYESVISYFETGKQPSENLLELKFRELLLNIITTESNVVLIRYFCKLAQDGTNDLKEVMENNCLYNLELHEYARLCHRSLSKFKRDFTAAFGETPGRWLLQKKLDHAFRLLVQTDKQVTDVAYESGFVNCTHFDRVFKENVGISPLKYRKQAVAVMG